MTKTILTCALLAGLGSLAVPAVPQQPPATPPPSQNQVVQNRRRAGGGPPKLAVAPFIALSQDAETVAAAKTITDVLTDDIAYEREFYMIGKDAVASAGAVSSLDNINLEPWKVLNPDGLVVGSVRKDGNSVVVQVKVIQVATGRMAFGNQYSGPVANPRRYAHTISDADPQAADRARRRGEHAAHLFVRPRPRARQIVGRESRRAGDLHRRLRWRQRAPGHQHDDAEYRAGLVARQPGDRLYELPVRRVPGDFGTYQDIIVSYIATGLRETPANGNPQQAELPADLFAGWNEDRVHVEPRRQPGNLRDESSDGSGMRRMTNNPAIDVTPTWSPNGSQLAWVSDRTGTPRIYIMNVDGTGQRSLIDEYLRSSDLGVRAVQRNRLCDAHGAGLRYQAVQFLHWRNEETHRWDRQQREPGVLAQRPAHRVHLDAQRQGPGVHDRPDGREPAPDHARGQ